MILKNLVPQRWDGVPENIAQRIIDKDADYVLALNRTHDHRHMVHSGGSVTNSTNKLEGKITPLKEAVVYAATPKIWRMK